MRQHIAKFIAVAAVSILTLQMAQAGITTELAPVELSPQRRQLIGVTFATVARRRVAERIDATGSIEPDEQLQADVQTRFAGWIQQVFANQTSQYVRRGQPLFTVYSPELASTEEEYVLALGARDRVEGSLVEGVSDGAKSLARAAAERLSLMGIPPSEIARLARERRPRNVLTIYSPVSGFVVDRAALPNMYVQPGTKLYRITDFSTVWVYAAVFQDEVTGIRAGDRAVFTVDAFPGEKFSGRVDYVWPQVDLATRTVRVRIAFENRGGKLKPGMYGRVALRVNLGERTVIPAGGVLRTGKRDIAFVDRGNGYLTPAYVEIGPRAGNDLVVLDGLKPGQRIVASANFLIDSESQIQAAAGSFAPSPAGSSESNAPAAKPSASLAVVTIPSPPVRDKNRVRATLKDARGGAIDGASVTVTFYMAAMPAMGMAAMRNTAVLRDRGSGVYEGEVMLQSGGTWQLSAVANQAGRTVAATQMSVSVAGGM